MAAVAVDRSPNERRHQAPDQQADRESAHRESEGPAALRRNQWNCQHRRIEDRAPGKYLRDAQYRNCAPGTEPEVTRARHPSRGRLRRGVCRHLPGEAFEPGGQSRMCVAPSSVEAEIEIAKCASRGDLSDMRCRVESGRTGLQRSQRAAYFVRLMREPFRLMLRQRTPAAFVNLQDRGIENAVGERLQAQRGKAGGGLCWNDASASAAVVEIF